MTFKNAISWFEIPVIDMDRAQTFYETIFDVKLQAMDMPDFDLQMRSFPVSSLMSISGALCKSKDFYKPSADSGPLVYFNANPDLQIILDRIEAAGGTIIIPKTEISPSHGHMGVFLDSEGNRIALHSLPEGMSEE